MLSVTFIRAAIGEGPFCPEGPGTEPDGGLGAWLPLGDMLLCG